MYPQVSFQFNALINLFVGRTRNNWNMRDLRQKSDSAEKKRNDSWQSKENRNVWSARKQNDKQEKHGNVWRERNKRHCGQQVEAVACVV